MYQLKGSWAILMMPVSLEAAEIGNGSLDGSGNGRLTKPERLLTTSGWPAEIGQFMAFSPIIKGAQEPVETWRSQYSTASPPARDRRRYLASHGWTCWPFSIMLVRRAMTRDGEQP